MCGLPNNLGDKSISTFIEKVSDAIGVLYEPTKIIKNAKAQATANEILADSELKIIEQENRAIKRWAYEESVKQENIESLIKKTIPKLLKDAKPEELNKDWLFKFFEEVKFISDEEIQEKWSQILAEESNKPKTFSKKTVRLIADLEKEDILLFENLLKFNYRETNKNKSIHALVFDFKHKIYISEGINFMSLKHLENLGLIQVFNVGNYTLGEMKGLRSLILNSEVKILDFKKNPSKTLAAGKVVLTKAGEELASISRINTTREIESYIISEIEKQNITITNQDDGETITVLMEDGGLNKLIQDGKIKIK